MQFIVITATPLTTLSSQTFVYHRRKHHNQRDSNVYHMSTLQRMSVYYEHLPAGWFCQFLMNVLVLDRNSFSILSQFSSELWQNIQISALYFAQLQQYRIIVTCLKVEMKFSTAQNIKHSPCLGAKRIETLLSI